MMRNTLLTSTVTIAAVLGLGTSAVFMACANLEKAPTIQEMSEADFAQWRDSTAMLLAAFARAGVQEGDLQASQVEALAGRLSAIADGSSPGTLMDYLLSLQFDGYKGLALLIALQEFGGKLSEYGGTTVEGLLTPRGVDTVRAVAAKLQEALPE